MKKSTLVFLILLTSGCGNQTDSHNLRGKNQRLGQVIDETIINANLIGSSVADKYNNLLALSFEKRIERTQKITEMLSTGKKFKTAEITGIVSKSYKSSVSNHPECMVYELSSVKSRSLRSSNTPPEVDFWICQETGAFYYPIGFNQKFEIGNMATVEAQYHILENGELVLFNYLDLFPVVGSCSELFEGNGSETNPYLISSASDFNNIAVCGCGGKENRSCKDYFELKNSIDFSPGCVRANDSTCSQRSNFRPVGRNYFSGRFNGNGYTLAGPVFYDSKKTNVGLFSGLKRAKVYNLEISDVSISASKSAGILAGRAVKSDISNINVYKERDENRVVVSARNASAGGVVSSSYKSNFKKINIDAILEVEGDQLSLRIGGLIGAANKSTISSSSFTGKILAENSIHLGGLVGSAGRTEITDSFAHLDIDNLQALNAGGLVGQLSGSDSRIIRSYSSGRLKNKKMNTGGLVGRANGGSILDSYSLLELSGPRRVGGISGQTSRSVGIENCYFAGSMKDSEKFQDGAIAAYRGSKRTLKNCFWSSESGVDNPWHGQKQGIAGVATKLVGTKNGDAAVFQKEQFDGFDFTNIWTLRDGLPRLKVHEADMATKVTAISPIGDIPAPLFRPTINFSWMAGAGERFRFAIDDLTTGEKDFVMVDQNFEGYRDRGPLLAYRANHDLLWKISKDSNDKFGPVTRSKFKIEVEPAFPELFSIAYIVQNADGLYRKGDKGIFRAAFDIGEQLRSEIKSFNCEFTSETSCRLYLFDGETPEDYYNIRFVDFTPLVLDETRKARIENCTYDILPNHTTPELALGGKETGFFGFHEFTVVRFATCEVEQTRDVAAEIEKLAVQDGYMFISKELKGKVGSEITVQVHYKVTRAGGHSVCGYDARLAFDEKRLAPISFRAKEGFMLLTGHAEGNCSQEIQPAGTKLFLGKATFEILDTGDSSPIKINLLKTAFNTPSSVNTYDLEDVQLAPGPTDQDDDLVDGIITID